MSSLIVEVCEIEERIDLEDCHSLDLYRVKGWYSISGKKLYVPGDKVVFIPPETEVTDKFCDYFCTGKVKIHKNRIKTEKIRGCISQGLLLDLRDSRLLEFYPELAQVSPGDDVANILEVRKWEPKNVPTNMKGKAVKRHPQLEKYTDIENIKNFNKVFQDEELVIVTEKLHGCMQANTKIALSDGSTKTIREIVDNKLDIEILGMDDEGELVPQRIKNWFNHGVTDDWLNIRFKRNRVGSGNSYGSLKCTSDHKIFTENRGWIEAKDLNLGIDKIKIFRGKLILPYLYEQILIGKMLGDGSLGGSGHIEFGHKKEHEEYVDFTLKSLGDLAGTKSYHFSGYGSEMCKAKTKGRAAIQELFKSWYPDRDNKLRKSVKQIPHVLDLSPISLAFMYMDDGSLHGGIDQEYCASIATCNFDTLSIEYLIESLANIGIEAKMSNSDGYPRLRIGEKSIDKFFTLISQYIPRIMQYKLPESYRTGKDPEFIIPKLEWRQELVSQEIISITPLINNKLCKDQYDLETELHNYIAGSVVVHNSSFHSGMLSKMKPTFFDRVKSFFGIKSSELCVSSRNTQVNFMTNKEKLFGDLGTKDNNVYSKTAEKLNLDVILEPGMILYGEIVGPGIQKNYHYGVKPGETEFYAYDLKVDGKFQPHQELEDFCRTHGIKTVPTLYIGPFSKEKIEELTSGDSMVGGQKVREGVVIRSISEQVDPKLGRKILKSINPKYLLKDQTEYH